MTCGSIGESRSMISSEADRQDLKATLKEALVEILREQRPLLQEVVAEALEDVLLAEAIQEGQQTKSASREKVFRMIRG